MPFPLQQVGSWISFTVMTQTLPGRFETEQRQFQNYFAEMISVNLKRVPNLHHVKYCHQISLMA